MSKLVVSLENKEFIANYISYKSRILEDIIYYLIFYTMFVVLSTFLRKPLAGTLFILFFVVLFYTLESRSWAKGYITHIRKHDGKILVTYFIKDREFTIEDKATSFSFKKKHIWYKKGRSPFFQVKHNGNVIVRLYPVKDIREAIFDKMIEEFGE